MSISTKEVSYCTEVDNLLGVVVGVIVDIKAGKTPVTIVGDLLPQLIAAIAGMGDLKIELADRKDLEATVALKLAEIVNIMVG